MVLHWRGGDHTALKVKKNTTGKHRWTVAEASSVMPAAPVRAAFARLSSHAAVGHAWRGI